MIEVDQELLFHVNLGEYLAQQTSSAIWGGSYNAYHQAINAIAYDPINQVVQEQPKKKKERFIVELREELRKWHGDLN